MAIKVNGTTVVNDSRELQNISGIDATTSSALSSALGGGVAVQSTAPSSPANGDFWIDTDDNFLRIYNDGVWSTIEYVGSSNSHSSAVTFYSTLESAGHTQTTNWNVPAGVNDISVVVIGAGGRANGNYNAAAAGGGLAYKNNIPVDPGDVFTIGVGLWGSSGGQAGGTSYFQGTDADGNAVNVQATGGSATTSKSTTPSGGTGSGGDAGYTGGSTGTKLGTDGVYRYSSRGGGGAAGYSGNGGVGGGVNSSNLPLNGTAGSGGAGGGGGAGSDTRYNYGGNVQGNGGGTGVYGSGSSGSGGTGASGTPGQGGAGGLGSDNSDAQAARARSFKSHFGGGGGGGYGQNSASGSNNNGAVRIVWQVNGGQAFPSTNVGFKDQDASTSSTLETQIVVT